MRNNPFRINVKREIVRSAQFGNGPLPNWILNTHHHFGTFRTPGYETYRRARMTESLALIPSAVEESQLNRNAAFREPREMVLNSVVSEHSKRNYAKALLDAGPLPAFLQDLLQNTQFAVDQIGASRFSSGLLVPPEVTYIDVLKGKRSERGVEEFKRSPIVAIRV